MKIYANKALGFSQLLGNIFAGYPLVLKNIWYLLLAIIVLIIIPVLIFPLNSYIGGAVSILILLAVIFIFAITLYISNAVFADKSASLSEANQVVRKRYLFVLGGMLLAVAIMVIAIIIDFGIFAIGDWLGLHTLALVVVFIFTVFAGLLFYFALPLIIIEKQGILKSFEKSARLFLANAWRIVAVFVVIHLITFLVSSLGLLFFHFPKGQLLYFVYTLILQFLIYPLIISTILILMQDAGLRLKDES